MKKPAVSVVVTVLNEAATIDVLLAALVGQRLPAEKIIIVDGGSTDETVAKIHRFQKKAPAAAITVFVCPGNRSQGRNYGVAQVKTPYVAITDAGCIPQPDWLAELVRAAQTAEADHPHRQLVVAGYYSAQPHTPLEEAVVPYVLVMPDQVNPHHFLPATRSVLISLAAWKTVGGFHERLSDNEDYEWARRLQRYPQVTLVFAARAQVTWLPRSSLSSFAWMIFRFARGDAQAGIWRPKVVLLFGRYLLLMLVSFSLLAQHYVLSFLLLLVVGLCVYSLWAIAKNLRYVPHGWYWLPILQLTADLAVLAGSVVGLQHSSTTKHAADGDQHNGA